VCPLPVSPLEFGHTVALIDRARTPTLQWLDAGGLERAAVPEQLRPHQRH